MPRPDSGLPRRRQPGNTGELNPPTGRPEGALCLAGPVDRTVPKGKGPAAKISSRSRLWEARLPRTQNDEPLTAQLHAARERRRCLISPMHSSPTMSIA